MVLHQFYEKIVFNEELNRTCVNYCYDTCTCGCCLLFCTLRYIET